MAAKVWNSKTKSWERAPDAPRPFPEDVVATIQSRVHLLDERHRVIIMLRFNFDSIKVFTTVELAEKLNISRHRIGQLETRALRKLGVKVVRVAGRSEITSVFVDGHKMPDTKSALRAIIAGVVTDTTLDNGAYI